MLGIYFLGTSSGVPTKDRNVSGIAVLLPEAKSWVLVDCGEGTQQQILHSPLSLNSLEAICITHMHGDHCYGLPGLIASAGMSGRRTPLTVVGPKAVEEMYLAVAKCSDLHTPFEVNFVDSEALGSWSIGTTQIEAIALSHRVPSHAFSFAAKATRRTLLTDKLLADNVPRGPAWGRIQKGEPVKLESGETLQPESYVDQTEIARRMIVCGDNDRPDCLGSHIDQADVVIHEATYTESHLQKIGPGPQHCSALRIAGFAEKKKLPNLILTHFSPRFHTRSGAAHSIDDIELEAREVYSGELFIAEDHARYELSETGELKLSSSASG
ncbi:MAG: ribonuclease Z [Pseudomonadota bacterium]